MSTYQITCATRAGATVCAYRHIVSVEISGTTWPVADVVKGIDNGDRFYTVGPTSKEHADVHTTKCASGHTTIQTDGDDTKDNNLVNLPC